MSADPRPGRATGPTTPFPWWAAAVLAAVGAGLVATAPQPPRADVPPASGTTEPVTRTVLACPPGIGDAVVKVAAADDAPGAGTGDTGNGGPVEVEVAQPDTEPGTVSLDRGGLQMFGVEAAPVVLRATGGSARGLLAVRGERAAATLAGAGCLAPQPVWWFAGAGGGVDHSSVLFLTNADEGPAVVDVRLHGATGSVDEAGTRGITLAAGETVRLALDELAPGSAELAVEVSSSRGRVVAHVLDTVRDGGSEGREWLPAAVPPGEDLTLPGVPAAAVRVQLLVTNPGEDQALVDLQVVTADGAFVPLGSEQVSVDPGTVERVDLTRALEGRAAAVRLRGAVPVTAAVRSWSGSDVAYAVPAAGLEGPAGAVVVGDRSEVLVVGGDEPAVLQLVMRAADGREVLRRGVTVPPSGLVLVPAPRTAAHVVLVPSSGGGSAAIVHSGGGIASRPFTVLPSTVLRPTVRPWGGQSPS